MKRIGASSRYDVRCRTSVASEFRVRVVGKNSELGDRIDGRLKNKTSVHSVDIVGTVDQKIVRLRALAIDGVSLARSRRASGLEQSGGQGHDAGLKNSQLGEVTAVQRQVEDLALHHGLPETAHCALH